MLQQNQATRFRPIFRTPATEACQTTGQVLGRRQRTHRANRSIVIELEALCNAGRIAKIQRRAAPRVQLAPRTSTSTNGPTVAVIVAVTHFLTTVVSLFVLSHHLLPANRPNPPRHTFQNRLSLSHYILLQYSTTARLIASLSLPPASGPSLLSWKRVLRWGCYGETRTVSGTDLIWVKRLYDGLLANQRALRQLSHSQPP